MFDNAYLERRRGTQVKNKMDLTKPVASVHGIVTGSWVGMGVGRRSGGGEWCGRRRQQRPRCCQVGSIMTTLNIRNLSFAFRNF
jgi:hypothetical protein